jgi:hypothetical protein
MKSPIVRRQTMDAAVANAKRATRRSMIDHLRQNPRGLALLDHAYLSDMTCESVTVFGEQNAIVDSTFTTSLKIPLPRTL